MKTNILYGAAALALVGLLFVATGVSADTRSDRTDRGSTTPPPAVPPATPPPSPVPPYSGNGNITNTTTGSVDSGGNSGGNVTTGDESITIHIVNIGPTNNPPPPPATGGSGDSDSQCESTRTARVCDTQITRAR